MISKAYFVKKKKKQWVTLFKSNYTGGLWVLLISTLS